MKNGKRFQKQNKLNLFSQILSSYCVLIIVVLLFSLFFYSRIYRSMKNSIQESQSTVLSQTVDSLDRLLSEVSNTGHQVLASPQVSSLMYCQSKDLNVYKMMQIRKLQEELIRRLAYNDSINSIMVFFTRSGVLASNTGLLRGDRILHDLSVSFGYSEDQLKSRFAAHQTLLTGQVGNQKQLTVLAYDSVIRSYPDTVCLLSIKPQAIANVLQNASDEWINIWLLDENDCIIYPEEENPFNEDILSKLNSEVPVSMSLNGKNCQFLSEQVSLTNWKVVACIDEEYFEKPLYDLKHIYIVVTSGALCLGVFLAVLFTQQRTMRIKRITRRFIENAGETKNELAALEEGMQRLLNENQNYRDNITLHMKEIRENWLIRVMHGKILSTDVFLRECNDYQTGFQGNNFAILCMDVIGYTNVSDVSGNTDEDTFDLINYCLDTFAVEFLSQQYNSQSCMYNGNFYYLLNFKNEAPPTPERITAEKEAMQQMCEKLVTYVESRIGVKLRCCFSELVTGPVGIADAYTAVRDGIQQMETYNISVRVADNASLSEVKRAEKDSITEKDNTHAVSQQTEQIRGYIDETFRDSMMTVALLAERFHVSQSYLLRIFRRDLGMGVLEYISQKRVEEAKRLLKETKATVSSIAEQVGYTNSLALIRAFHKQENLTPTEYRRLF